MSDRKQPYENFWNKAKENDDVGDSSYFRFFHEFAIKYELPPSVVLAVKQSTMIFFDNEKNNATPSCSSFIGSVNCTPQQQIDIAHNILNNMNAFTPAPTVPNFNYHASCYNHEWMNNRGHDTSYVHPRPEYVHLMHNNIKPRSDSEELSLQMLTKTMGNLQINNNYSPKKDPVTVDEKSDKTPEADDEVNQSNIEEIIKKDLDDYNAKHSKKPHNKYICNICYIPGHMISDCPKRFKKGFSTPYQGSKVCVGIYQCSKCKRVWNTGASSAGDIQKCRKCSLNTIPKKQFSSNVALKNALDYKKNPNNPNISGQVKNLYEYITKNL